LTGGLVK